MIYENQTFKIRKFHVYLLEARCNIEDILFKSFKIKIVLKFTKKLLPIIIIYLIINFSEANCSQLYKVSYGCIDLVVDL